VDARDMRRHVGDALGLPVAAIGVAAGPVEGLPAVVDDDRAATEFAGLAALRLDRRSVHRLMQAVPGRVHRQAPEVRHRQGRI